MKVEKPLKISAGGRFSFGRQAERPPYNLESGVLSRQKGHQRCSHAGVAYFVSAI